jgi:hypothetical protein
MKSIRGVGGGWKWPCKGWPVCSERLEKDPSVVCSESGVVLEMVWENADGGQPVYLISSSSGQTNRCLAIRAPWRHNHLPGTPRSQPWHPDRKPCNRYKMPPDPGQVASSACQTKGSGTGSASWQTRFHNVRDAVCIVPRPSQRHPN